MNIQAAGSSALYALSQPASLRTPDANGKPAGSGDNQPPVGSAGVSPPPGQTGSSQSPVAQTAPPTPQEQAKQEADAKATAEKLQKVVSSLGRDLNFSVDKDLGEVVIKITDPSTKEIIRQIPSEEALRIAKTIDTLKGVLIDQSA